VPDASPSGAGTYVSPSDPSPLSVLTAVVRRLAPQMIEATLIPSALCFAATLTVGLTWGVVAAATWIVVSITRRIACRAQVSALLVVATVGLSVRVGVYLLNENDFVYFVQPVMRTVATAVLFASSAVLGRPLVARFAHDFCSFDADVGSRPAIAALFRRLTYLWAGAQAVTAGVTLTLLLTVPVEVFIGAAAGATWLIIATCVVATVVDAVRTTRNDGIHTTIATGGRLHARLLDAVAPPAAPLSTV
jgi:hypothetical protein